MMTEASAGLALGASRPVTDAKRPGREPAVSRGLTGAAGQGRGKC